MGSTWLIGGSHGPKGYVYLRTEIPYFEDHFIGEPMAASWQPPAIRVGNSSKKLCDIVSWMMSAIVLSERAVDAFAPVIGSDCEFLPLLEIKGKKYFAGNVLRIVDCLIPEKSEIDYSEDDPKRIIGVTTMYLDEKRIPADAVVFKVPQDLGAVLVRQPFIDVVRQFGLTGGSFADPEVDGVIAVVRNRTANVVPDLPT